MTTTEENGAASTALARIATQIEGMDVRTLATVLVRSGYFTDTRDLSQATVKVLAGRELGFGPIASMQGVYIVKGRVSLASNLIAAAIQRSGRFRYRVRKLDRTGCSIEFFEREGARWELLGVSDFGPEDAAAAGLAKSDTYQHFPRNMYFARALTNGARWYCPEVFNGPVYTPDELGARVDDDGVIIEMPAAPPSDTEEVKRNNEAYERIIASQYDDEPSDSAASPSAAPSALVEHLPSDSTGAAPEPEQTDAMTDVLQRNENLALDAQSMGVKGIGHLRAKADWPIAKVLEANTALEDKIRGASQEVF